MASARTIVVTVPDMIGDSDLEPLRQLGEVRYHETDHVTEEQLAELCAGFDYLMLNYDVIKQLSADFYGHDNVRRLRAISADITGMDWASPEHAEKNGVKLLNIPHYSTESVAETILAVPVWWGSGASGRGSQSCCRRSAWRWRYGARRPGRATRTTRSRTCSRRVR
jgi:phosphoglycerate dehydrogenase-like enzyme